MSSRFNLVTIAIGLMYTSALSACGGGSSDAVTVTSAATLLADQAVSIQFAAVNGTTPVKCGTRLTGLGSTSVAADLTDLRFYITNVALINDKGVAVPVTLKSNNWQLTQGSETVSLIDLEDASGSCADATHTADTNAVITGTVPAGTYVGLKASMGVPETLNHSAITGGVAPLDVAATAWSWQSGRKFTKIEVNPVGGILKTTAAVPATATTPAVPASTSTVNTFYFHLGSTGCTAKVDSAGVVLKDAAGNALYTCSNPNVMDFTLASFDPAKQQVALDVGQLFKTTDITKDNGGAVGCMSGATDPECPTIFSEMKVAFGSGSNGLSINGGAGQQVFKAVTK